MSSHTCVVFHRGEELLHSPKTISAFVAKMTAGITPRPFEPENREEPRYTLSTIVELQPIDEQFQPAGDVFKAVTRDLSSGGIGLTHNREIASHFLAIQLTNAEGDQLQAAVKVVRCESYNNTWDIGAQFLTGSSHQQSD